MNFIEAIKLLQSYEAEGEKKLITRKYYSDVFNSEPEEGEGFALKDFLEIFLSNDGELNLEDILADDWLIVNDTPVLVNFKEASMALKDGKKIYRASNPTRVHDGNVHYNHHLFTIEETEANDWIIDN